MGSNSQNYDLVQRLRVSAGTAPHWLRNVYRDAADEIERLRAEVAHVHSLYWDCDGCLGRAIAERDKAQSELAALRERFEKAPSVDGARITYIEQDKVLDQLYQLSREGHRVRLVRED